MKLLELLLPGPKFSLRSSFQGHGVTMDAGGATEGGGEWWQDESGHWHFGGPAEYWWRDEHHQWHKGGESELWRQDEQGNWHEVEEDHPQGDEDELLMSGHHDMGQPHDDIKDLDALNGALKDDMPPMDPGFTPSIENIITKSGPTELGKEVAELSRSLGMLKDDVNSNLSQDRIAAMTSEDVPNMVTPVAASLKEVITSAKSLKERLGAIADAAYSIVGTATEDAEDRLSGEEQLDESPEEQLEEQAHTEEGDGMGPYHYGDHGYEDYSYGNGGYDDYGYGPDVAPDMVKGAQLPVFLWPFKEALFPTSKIRSAQRRPSFL